MAPSQSSTPGRKDDKMTATSHTDNTPSMGRISGSPSFMMTPSLMTPKPVPRTAATEAMTDASEPFSVASSQPSAAPKVAPLPHTPYEDDEASSIRAARLFQETPSYRHPPQDRPARRESPRVPPIPDRVDLSLSSKERSTSSLPEPVRNHVRSASASSCSGSASQLQSHHRNSSSNCLHREEPWLPSESCRRRASQELARRTSSGSTVSVQNYSSQNLHGSTNLHRKGSFQTPRNQSTRKSFKMSPEVSSNSNPDCSQENSPSRSARPMSPLPRKDGIFGRIQSALGYSQIKTALVKALNYVYRIRTSRLVLILCLVAILSLTGTVFMSRAVIPEAGVRYRPDAVPRKPGLRVSGSMMLKKPNHRSGKEKIVKEEDHHSEAAHTSDKHHHHEHKHSSDKHHHSPDKHHHSPDKHHHSAEHKDKHHHRHESDHKHGKHSKHTPSTMAKPVLHLKVAQPKPLKDIPPNSFDVVDASLYKKPSESASVAPRIIKIHDSAFPTPDREVQSIYSEVFDNTQLYGILDSDDERLEKMEMRDPYSQGECVPMQDWQTTFHPSCNGMHELPLEHMGEDNGNDVNLFGTKGYWRNAWKLDFQAEHNTVVLKTLKFQHNFEDAHFEHDRIDAIAMERLTSSPHVIDIFGFCGHSVLTEYADGKRLGELADKSKKTPLARLKIARDIAEGLADVHGIDGDDNATFVHLDVNPANVVSIGGRLKLNDFNIGIILRWNTTSNTQCGFPAQYPNPQWRSPEEARGEQNLSEKVDVFSMGHIFFRLICGHEPWNKLEPGGKPSKEEVNEKVQKGVLPYIPKHVLTTTDEEMIAIRDVMIRCYTYDPNERPSAREIANTLDKALSRLTSESASP